MKLMGVEPEVVRYGSQLHFQRARVAKSADAKDLKSFFRQRECGFKSRPGHQNSLFPKANFVYAGGKFIVVDEDGGLTLAKFTPEGATVISKASLLEHNAWTAPSLAGTKLYVRDRKSIVALDLAAR